MEEKVLFELSKIDIADDGVLREFIDNPEVYGDMVENLILYLYTCEEGLYNFRYENDFFIMRW